MALRSRAFRVQELRYKNKQTNKQTQYWSSSGYCTSIEEPTANHMQALTPAMNSINKWR